MLTLPWNNEEKENRGTDVKVTNPLSAANQENCYPSNDFHMGQSPKVHLPATPLSAMVNYISSEEQTTWQHSAASLDTLLGLQPLVAQTPSAKDNLHIPKPSLFFPSLAVVLSRLNCQVSLCKYSALISYWKEFLGLTTCMNNHLRRFNLNR